jgi:vacuolar-type H+-ATPase subunit E/Vma4
MITVEDKLNTFSKGIIDKVKKEAEQKLGEAREKSESLFDAEKRKAEKEVFEILEQAKKQAESEKNRIISKALMDKDRAVLIKQKELFERFLDYLGKLAREYTQSSEYLDFLEKCIRNGLASIDSAEGTVLITPGDEKEYGDRIRLLMENMPEHKNFKTGNVNEDIIGGCIIENGVMSVRTDCSLAALIDDCKESIGRQMMNNI